ncbi:MAG: hypothetical protein QW587_04185 [Candidatus Bathyarchaeia archaeon]
MEPFTRRSHVSLWRWVQGLAPLERLFKPRRVRCFLVDEAMVKGRPVRGVGLGGSHTSPSGGGS